MNDTTIELEETKDEIFACDVADDALEAAGNAESGKMAYTQAFCTGLAVCPT